MDGSSFPCCLLFLISMCEVVIYGDSEYEIYNAGRSVEERNAQAHLNVLESFESVYIPITQQRSLLYLKEAITKLQGQS